jgi:putative tricarboxylic transport membrane protein
MANVITLLLPVFSLWYLWQSYLLPSGNVLIGARTFPLLTGGLMLIVSLVLVWQQFRPAAATAGDKKTAGPALDVEEGEGEITVEDWPATLVVIGAVLAFIVAFEPLGFVIAITLFLFGLSSFFSPQRWGVNLIVAVCFALGAYVLFTQGLSVQLPNGPLESLF